MGRTEFNLSTPGFVCDNNSMRKNSGRQIDWDNVAAGYVDADSGKKVIPAGTVMSASDAGDGSILPDANGSHVSGNPIGLLVSTAIEDDESAALSGYGVYVGGVVYRDLLPETVGGTLSAESDLQSNGLTFQFETYADDSVS
jgi:hypothetical protein